jgi:hypothetical protein
LGFDEPAHSIDPRAYGHPFSRRQNQRYANLDVNKWKIRQHEVSMTLIVDVMEQGLHQHRSHMELLTLVSMVVMKSALNQRLRAQADTGHWHIH